MILVNKFEDNVYEGAVPAELQETVVHCADIVGYVGMEPVGITCPKASARDIHAVFQRSPMPKHMAFSGTIWMLELHHRAQPVDKNGFCKDAVGIGADGRETECEQGVGNGRGACRISSR